MSSEILRIKDEKEAFEYVRNALEGSYDRDVIELEFSGWPQFHINVKGAKYDSTLTAALMRSLLELQTHLNRVYAEVVYGKSARSLTDDERKSLEIVYKIESGSSNVVADLSGFFTEMGKSAVDKMTGTQVVMAVLGAAVIWGGTSLSSSYFSAVQKSKEEENRHEVTMALINKNHKLKGIKSEQEVLYTNILRSVQDAEKVTLGTTEIPQSVLEEITKPDRQKLELKRVDDQYQIISLKVKPDSYRIELFRVSDGKIIPTELFKGHLLMSEMDSIMKAFSSETSIQLNVVAKIKGESITSASILGVNNKAKGESVAATPPT